MAPSATAEAAKPIRVLVVDDHEAVRTGLERVLQRSSDFALVSALADHRRLFELLSRERIDVVILDYDLERTDGLSLCSRIKQIPAPPAVVIYSGYAAPPIVLAATVAQADAVVHKAEPVSELLDALRRLSRGQPLLGPPAPDLLEAVAARLDAGDLPVMALLVERADTADIARALGFGEDEVLHRARRIIGLLQAGRTRRPPQPAT
jgi:DNA-binding NarL/FixJ family response regulator